jgi:predicted secreted Zn-dependent protease
VTFKADIATLYNRIVKEKEDMQETYDGQTDHSRKRGVQVNWLERIDQMLIDTDVFSTYP